MAGSGSKNWHQEIKSRLSEKVANNINDLGSLCKQVSKGSKSLEVCSFLTYSFFLLENETYLSANNKNPFKGFRKNN